MERKNILITGASRGIGYGTAVYLIHQGYNVILVARNMDSLNSLKKDYPDQVEVVQFDLLNVERIEEIFIFCKEKHIILDGMVHAAGVSTDCPVKSIDVEEMKHTMDINYFSYVQLSRFFTMKKYSANHASIVAFSSLASFSCEKGMSQYAASKAAVNAFTKSLSKESVRRGIRVNAIAPGFVDTDMTWDTANYVENFEENLKERQPLGVIPVLQIAYLVEFLLSDSSKYITGDIIPITGGSFGA